MHMLISKAFLKEITCTPMYTQKQCVKGSSNVAGLNLQTLHRTGVLLKDRKGGKLLLFDNCIGQNKNHYIICLSPLLVEGGFFTEVAICYHIV